MVLAWKSEVCIRKTDMRKMASLDILLKEGEDFPYELTQRDRDKLKRDLTRKIRVSLSLKSRDRIEISLSQRGQD